MDGRGRTVILEPIREVGTGISGRVGVCLEERRVGWVVVGSRGSLHEYVLLPLVSSDFTNGNGNDFDICHIPRQDAAHFCFQPI